jgi:hypothetical protein
VVVPSVTTVVGEASVSRMDMVLMMDELLACDYLIVGVNGSYALSASVVSTGCGMLHGGGLRS